MKRIFLLFVLIFILMIQPREIFGQWVKTVLPDPPYGHGALPGKVVVLTANGNNLYAGTLGGNVYFSQDQGKSWAYIDSGLTTADINAIAYFDSTLFVGTYGSGQFGFSWGGIFMTKNNGKTWTQAKNLADNNIYNFAVQGTNILAATWGGGILISSDNGVTWNPSNNGLSATENVRCLLVNNNYIYAGTWGDGFFFSNDNGNSWIPLNTGLSNLYIYQLAIKNNTIYLASDAGIYTSTNNGLNWTLSDSGMTTSFIRAFEVVDPKVLVGTSGEGVFVSMDNGATWNPVDTGLTEPYIYCFANIGTSIFAGSWDGEIWIRSVSEMLKTTLIAIQKNKPVSNFELSQNYPNPFNPSTNINFSVPYKSTVTLKVYDALGRLVSNLINGEVRAGGNYKVSFNADKLASGIYFYQLVALAPTGDNFVSIKKMILLK